MTKDETIRLVHAHAYNKDWDSIRDIALEDKESVPHIIDVLIELVKHYDDLAKHHASTAKSLLVWL